eukprot:g14388.t1 g14388   contig9:1732035-1734419(+)
MNASTSASASAPPTYKKKNKKKRKKSSVDSNSTLTDTNAILHSKLSLKKRLFLKKSAKQTPWYDTNELSETGRGLLLALKLFPSPHAVEAPVHDDLDPTQTIEGLTQEEYLQLQSALRRVALWRGRCGRGGRLSHAVDMTAGLAGILLTDAERESALSLAATVAGSFAHLDYKSTTQQPIPNNNTSLYQLRNTYSTLLLRSVNGLADTYRHQRKSALLSVSHCCALAGLPLWIVDVRHDASHNELPSLGVCRIGALESLRFWKRRYWDLLQEKVWGDIKESDAGGTQVRVEESGDGEQEGGICTLAMDCLVRYQKAAMLEAAERAKLRDHQLEKREKRQLLSWEQRRQLQKEEAVAESDEAKKSDVHKSQTDYAAEDEIILLPSNDEENTTLDAKGSRDPSKGNETQSYSNPWSILDDDKPKKKRKKKASAKVDVLSKNNAPTDNVNMEEAQLDDASAQIEASSENEPRPLDDTDKSIPTKRDCAAEFIRTIPIDIAFSSALRFLIWGRPNSQGPALLTLSTETNNECQTEEDLEATFEDIRLMYDTFLVAMASSYPGFVSALLVHLIDAILSFDIERHSHQHDQQLVDQIDRNIRCLTMWVYYILSREFHMHFDTSAAIYEYASATSQNKDTVDLKKKGRKKWTLTEQSFMQSPLSYNLLHGLGMPLNSVCDRLMLRLHDTSASTEENTTTSEKSLEELHSFLEEVLGRDRVICMGLQTKNNKGLESTEAKDEQVALSLEEIEAMVSGGGRNNDTATSASLRVTDLNSFNLHPWTLCKSWDCCAIGSMPGFPS